MLPGCFDLISLSDCEQPTSASNIPGLVFPSTTDGHSAQRLRASLALGVDAPVVRSFACR
jgi:hypothetical protein